MTVSKPYTFTSGDILASEVNADFDELYDALNNDYMDLAATSPFSNVPSGPSTDPSSADHLTRKQYVDRRITGGSSTVALNTESGGGAANITHGLGTTPTWAIAVGSAPQSGTTVPVGVVVYQLGAATFRVRCFGPDGSALSGETVTIMWACGS